MEEQPKSVQEKCNYLQISLTIHFENTPDPRENYHIEVALKEHSEDEYRIIAITERLPGSSAIAWAESFTLLYKFQKQQKMKFLLYKSDFNGIKVLAGQAKEDLSRILRAGSYIGVLDGNNNSIGRVDVNFQEQLESRQKVYMIISGRNLDDLDTFTKSDPYIKLYKGFEDDWLLIYESKIIMNNLNPSWDPITMDYSFLCDNKGSTKMKIECFDFDDQKKSDFIGECEFHARDLIKGKKFILYNPEKSKSNTGAIVIEKFDLIDEGSFIDYLRQGMRINLTIAIDYTSSNGLITNNNSLHYLSSESKNEYEQALEKIGKILSEYDDDKKYSIFGFGGEPEWLDSVSHCFALNGFQDNPYIKGFENVLQVYKNTLPEIKLSGPTKFRPLLEKQLEICRNSDENTYHILLILTDGVAHDLQETIDLLVIASREALSVLFIGIGPEHFLDLKKLDSDIKMLENSKGNRSQRDIVQFVSFREFEGDIEGFAREALMEIPSQMMQYMEFKRKKQVEVISSSN